MRPIQTIACALSLFLCGCSAGSAFREVEIGEPYGRKVDSVLSLMTLEEKIGQLNQYTGNGQATGPVIDDTTKIAQIEKGLVGSMLNIRGAERTRRLQEHAMKSRLRIPLLFGLDVIHGMQTVFPVPLAEASSFDLDLMRRTAAGAAREAAAQGVHWTFAPMVDISRDARWGRVVEGAGEDPWYGSLVARARVEGFQGRSLADVTTVMACAKHFAAYGACIAGKDYNTTDLSLLTLHDTYLPPFRAAVESGVGSVMNGFNDLNGIPATGNAYLQRTLLKGEWGFDGLTVSDWGSIGEMVPHGYAADLRDAARAAITAGCDVDMESRAYVSRLRELVADGEVAEACIDDAVRRILLKKFQLGLFDDPFRYCDPEPLTEEGFPIYMLKTKAPNSSCIFLTDGRCSVYPARTRTCRIYPLTVGPGERGRDFEYCLCLDRHQSHFTGSRVSVKDWLYQNFKREDKEYVKREYEIATELGKLMRAIDPTMRPGIVFKVLYYRHYNFDLDQPFQPQYEQNNRHLLADLHRIAGEQ